MPNSHTKAPPDPSPKQKQLQDLKATHTLLHLAHHRNHNQHRRSKWWKELSMLRRGVAGLIKVLEDRKECGGGDDGEQRMGFLAREVIPRCWVSFSAVVADNQYAPLGLLLLGTLARLGKVIGLEKIGEGEESGEVEVREGHDAMVDVDTVETDGDLLRAETGIGHGMEDIGVAVAREEVEAGSDPRETKYGSVAIEKHARQVGIEEVAAMVETGTPTPVTKRKKKKRRDAIDELFKGLI